MITLQRSLCAALGTLAFANFSIAGADPMLDNANESVIGDIRFVRPLTNEEGCKLEAADQFAILYSSFGTCSLKEAKSCPIRSGDVLLLSGVRVEYSLCEQYARTIEFTNGPIEYGFSGTCATGITETVLVMPELMSGSDPSNSLSEQIN